MSTAASTSEGSARPAGRSVHDRLPARPPLPTGWALVGAIAFGVVTVVLVVRASSLIVAMDHNADSSAPIAMAEYAHRYRDAQLATGRLGWWGGLWFLQLIRPLPGNTYVGNYLPMLVTFGVAALLALQSRRLWGPRAPWIVLLVAFALPAEAWVNMASWSARAPSFWSMGLLGSAAVAAARPGMSRARWLVVSAGGVLACAVTAIAASGDQIAAVALVPLVGTGLYAARVRRFPLAGVAIAAAAVTFVASQLIGDAADRAGYLRQAFPVELIDLNAVGAQLGNLVIGLTNVWTGPIAEAGQDSDLVNRMGAVSGYVGFALVVTAVAVAAPAVWRVWLGRPVATDGPPPAARPIAASEDRDAAASGAPRSADEASAERADGDPLRFQRGVWVTFWALGLGVYLAAFWFTTASGPVGQPVTRYLYGVPMAAAAALVPLAATRRGPALTLGASLLGLLIAIGLVVHPPKEVPGDDAAHPSTFGRIGQIAAENHVTRGFTGYWMSYPLALQSGFKLDVTPAGTCTQTADNQVCAMYLHYIDQAYAPRPNTRSFLVIDTSAVGVAGFPGAFVKQIPDGWRPERIVDAGDGIKVAIFDYDVASKIQANSGVSDPRVGRGGPLAPPQ